MSACHRAGLFTETEVGCAFHIFFVRRFQPSVLRVGILSMANTYINFLVAKNNTAPRSLPESIRQVGNLSAGFCRSWLSNEIQDALTTSEEAFQLLDHIQNEFLRHRDEKSKLAGWSSNPFKVALDAIVGELIEPATQNEKEFFLSCQSGKGALPPTASPASLTLAVALNKLKHRSANAVNFTISPSGVHSLYIFTNAGMGKLDSISSFDISVFCKACKVATEAIDSGSVT